MKNGKKYVCNIEKALNEHSFKCSIRKVMDDVTGVSKCIEYKTCTECRHDLSIEVFTCLPPIYKYYCFNCGWRHNDREEVVRIPFGGNGLAMKSLVMREATKEEGMFVAVPFVM